MQTFGGSMNWNHCPLSCRAAPVNRLAMDLPLDWRSSPDMDFAQGQPLSGARYQCDQLAKCGEGGVGAPAERHETLCSNISIASPELIAFRSRRGSSGDLARRGVRAGI